METDASPQGSSLPVGSEDQPDDDGSLFAEGTVSAETSVVQRLKEELRRLRERLQATEEAYETAREQLEAQDGVRRHERAIERQRGAPSDLDRINAVIRSITRALVRAETRAEIEQVVCDRLAEAEPYVFAWIGAPNHETYEVEPCAWSGDDGYLQAVTITFDDSETGQGPTGRAIRTRSIQVAQNLEDDPAYAPWRDTARAHRHWSSAAIPLVHEDTLYGVLNVYADRPEAFDETERYLLAELGSTIPYAMNTLVTKEKYHTFVEDVLDGSDAGIFILDADFDVVWANETVERYFGVDRTDIVGRDHAEVIERQLKPVFADPDAFEDALTAVYADNTSAEAFECHVLPGANREERWLHHRSQPIESGRYAGGRVELYSDVTERKRAEINLRNSEERFRNTMEQSPLSIQIFDAKGQTIAVNPAWERLWGASREEVADYNILEDEQLKAAGLTPYIRNAFDGEVVKLPITYYDPAEIGKPGRDRWLEGYFYPLTSEDGETMEVALVHHDVTERKRAEEELRESEQHLRFALKAGEIGSWDWDLDSGLVTWSKNLEAIHGMRPGEFDGRFESFIDAVHPDDRDRLLAAIREAIEEDASYHIEHRWVCQDGEVIWLEGKGQVIRDEAGQPVRMTGICMDITRRKREERLREEQTHLLELIAAGAPLEECLSALCAAVPQLGPDVRAAVLLADEQRRSFRRPIAPDLPPSFGEKVEGTLIDGEAVGTCGEAMLRDTPVTCEDIAGDDTWPKPWRELCLAHDVRACHSTPIRDEEGVPRGTFMLYFDASRTPNAWEQRLADFGVYIASIALERERSRQALRASERQLQLAQETAELGTWELNLDTQVLDLSPRAAKLMGLAPDRTMLAEDEWRARIVPDDLPRLIAAIRASLDDDTFFDIEFRVQWNDGTIRWVHSRGGVVNDASDGAPRLYSACLDVTERKAAEEALREGEERLHLALEAAKMGAWELDLQSGDSPTRSPRHDRIFGYEEPLDDWSYETFIDHVYPEDRQDVQKHFEEALQTGTWTFECRIIRADGALRWIAGRGEFYYDAQEPVRAIGVVQDITERKRTEEERSRLLAQQGRHARQLQALAEASLKITAAPDLEATLQTVTDEARRIIGAHQAVTSMTADENWSQAVRAISLSDKYAAWRDYDAEPDGSGIYRLACRMNEPMRMTQAELEAHPAWRAFGEHAAEHPPMRGWLAVPLVGPGGDNIGLIQLSDKRDDGEFTRQDESILVQLAQFASVAIEETQAKEQIRTMNETLEERVEARTVQVRELASRLTMAEQKERRRLALILHDNLQQRLYGIQMRMAFVRKHAEAGAQKKLLDQLHQADELMDAAIATTRQLSVDLHPPVLKKEGLADALGWLRTQMSELHGVEVEVEAERGVRIGDEDLRVFLFQVVRELLFNVVKHAGIDRARVEIASVAGELVIRVVDAGRGFDPDEVKRRTHEEGFGLTAARERLELFGGGLDIDSAPGAGTRMTVRVPLDSDPHDAEDD